MAGILTRLNRELLDMNVGDVAGITAGPDNPENMLRWVATILGPDATPYSGGIFNLEILFPDRYPFSPPIVRFITRIFHPNIEGTNGMICLDILKDKWSPALNVKKILLSISSLMAEPNGDDPLNREAGRLYRDNLLKFEQIAREWTHRYAT